MPVGGGNGGVVPGNGSGEDPGEGQPPSGEGDSTPQDPTDGQSGGDNTGDNGNPNDGTGTGGPGSGNPNDGSGTGGPGSGTTNPAPGDPPEELACEKPPPEEDNQGASEEDQGFWGDLWDGVKEGLTYGYEFVKGFWAGIKDQISDLANLILHPIDTAKGLIELGKAFYDKPVETAKMIGEALGKDLSQLVNCGAYDQGLIVGKYVNPAFMLKLATKLAKFGDLAKAIKATKRDLGCASFEPGTLVWTPGGMVPIEQLKVDDSVRSRYEGIYTDSDQKITALHSREAPDSLSLVLEGYEVLRVTTEHPLWVQGKGWVEAGQIEVGESVASVNGDRLVMGNVPRGQPTKVHNLTVSDTHTYFAGKSGVWVHNVSCDIPLYRSPKSPSGFKIGASDGGSGSWVDANRAGVKDEALNFQQQVTGAPLDVKRIREYDVEGVKFDGFDANRKVLLDAKRYTELCPLADCKPEFLQGAVADKLAKEARNQIDAVMKSMQPNTPIEWHISNPEMANKVAEILDKKFIGNTDYLGKIKVIYTPDVVN